MITSKLIVGTLLLASYSFAEMNRNAACAAAKKCLALELSSCTIEELKPLEEVTYDAKMCAPIQEIVARGVDPKSSVGFQMFSYLGSEYRVTYQVTGTLPVNADMMNYLMDHTPFTAHLINAYQGTNYSLAFTYGDKWNFHGDNGRNLAGKFRWVLADSAKTKVGLRNSFWGEGAAKVLMWKLYGVALVFLDYDPIDQNQVKYRLRSIVFPDNAFLNSIMQMDMFRDVVMDKMRIIVGHVESSARMYAKGDRKPIAKAVDFQKTQWLREQLWTMEALVKRTGYGQKVWPLPPSPKAKPSEIWKPAVADSSNTSPDTESVVPFTPLILQQPTTNPQ
jgi:hypothetical protein